MGRKLTYIKSTGTQYIDTGIYPTANTKFVLDMAYNDVSGTRYSGLNISNSWFMFGENTYHEAYLGNKVVVFSTAASTERTTIVLDAQNKTATIGDETNSVAYTTFATPSVTLPLFAYRDASTWNGFASFKLYSCQIYDNDVLVRDFVPWENDDGEIGLYDKVNSVFYGDAAGGAFEAGEYDVAMVSHTFDDLESGQIFYARIFPVNPDGAAQSELDGQVASATTTSALTLSQLNEGDVVMIEENGTDVAFYLAKHDYESGLNGAGRTLMVRKDCYDKKSSWGSSNKYAESTMDTFLNGDYLALLDSAVQEAISKTKFYYTVGKNDNTVTTLERSVFHLSVTELDATKSLTLNTEGSALPIASELQVAYLNGSAVNQWTRTPTTGVATYCCYLDSSGEALSVGYFSGVGYYRPSFTLPGDMKVSGTPNADGSYNLVTFPSEPTEYILTDTITASQTWTAPADGYYQVEIHGRSGAGGKGDGGGINANEKYHTASHAWANGGGGGGGGGYSRSIVKLIKGDTIAVALDASSAATATINTTVDEESYAVMSVTNAGNGGNATDDTNAPGAGGAGGVATGGTEENINGGAGAAGKIDRESMSSYDDGNAYAYASGGSGGSAAHADGNAGGSGQDYYQSGASGGSSGTTGTAKAAFVKIYAGDTNAA